MISSTPVWREGPRLWILPVLLLALAIPVASGLRGDQSFIRGDGNVDGVLDISDPIFTLRGLFEGAALFQCNDAADFNDDGGLDITDAIDGLQFLFLQGSPPAAPSRNCGTDPTSDALDCESYPICGLDPELQKLVHHVLDRITFGPTQELLDQIRTREDLEAYIDAQIAAPANYNQEVHEPDLHTRVESLRMGFLGPRGDATQGRGYDRLKGMLLLDAVHSEWQLLQVVSRFWNNHFHTQADSVRSNFFQRRPRGGGATRATAEIFRAADANRNGTITQSEWNVFRNTRPAAIAWENFNQNQRNSGGGIDQAEFTGRNQIGYWKYRLQNQQIGVVADLERREYDTFRRLAFGRFRFLLEANAKSPVQVIYLNNFENTVREPNENYGREFFELYGIGVDHWYTQRDIEQASRVFTGWNVGRVRRAGYPASDINFTSRPDTQAFDLDQREGPLPTQSNPPANQRFPRTDRWNDGEYTWAFVFGNPSHRDPPDGHDWRQKVLFRRSFGGVDSFGNPLPASAELRIPANNIVSNRTTAAAMGEFNQVLTRLVSFRDTAKYISTKLIQLFVTDDLTKLAKTKNFLTDPDLAVMRTGFASVDRNGNGVISRQEWDEPVPLALPNGRPPDIFVNLDVDGDGRITRREYQEPDLLVDAIETWEDTQGNIRQVLRTILHSDEFLSLKFYREKVKDPFEVAASAVRALDGSWPVSQLNQLLNSTDDLQAAGMELFNFSDPTGESEMGFDWMHTIGLLERLRYLNRGANPVSSGERRFIWNPTLIQNQQQLNTAERMVDYLISLLLAGDVPESHRELALQAYRSAPSSNRMRVTTAFIISLPEFQKQ